jgi:hypothetical protein
MIGGKAPCLRSRIARQKNQKTGTRLIKTLCTRRWLRRYSSPHTFAPFSSKLRRLDNIKKTMPLHLLYFVLLFFGFSTVGSVAQEETDHVRTDINCKNVNVHNSNPKFLPGTNVPFTIYFGKSFSAAPRLLVSVGYGDANIDHSTIPLSYDNSNYQVRNVNAGCPLSFTTLVTYLDKAWFTVDISRQLATATAAFKTLYHKCFEETSWPESLRVCWVAWTKGKYIYSLGGFWHHVSHLILDLFYFPPSKQMIGTGQNRVQYVKVQSVTCTCLLLLFRGNFFSLYLLIRAKF